MYKIIAIVAPTGTGKDEYIYYLAERLQIPILIVDSMKIYRLMNIGTSKPPNEYLIRYVHFGINIKNHWETFNAGEFFEYARSVFSKFNRIIAVAGTPMYLKVILHGIFEESIKTSAIRNRLYEEAAKVGLQSLFKKLQKLDPEYSNKISPNDKKRIIRALEVIESTGQKFSEFHIHFKRNPTYKILTLGISEDKERLRKHIEERTKEIIKNGIVDEVKMLRKIADFSVQAKEAIGYKDTINFLETHQSIEQLISSMNKRTIRYIKHQNTWFKKMVDVWFYKEEKATEKMLQAILKFLQE